MNLSEKLKEQDDRTGELSKENQMLLEENRKLNIAITELRKAGEMLQRNYIDLYTAVSKTKSDLVKMQRQNKVLKIILAVCVGLVLLMMILLIF